ncbi:hypothetical protein T02_2029 [Trichinella nativa]|uniref:Uncharacterized protein n=1 Tax=Trichinella nativa TaxID=6335 RepID=A0A0V1KQY1_9BILA|nr:hypothetical protein T02_2029 [Trichinella nativa]
MEWLCYLGESFHKPTVVILEAEELLQFFAAFGNRPLFDCFNLFGVWLHTNAVYHMAKVFFSRLE